MKKATFYAVVCAALAAVNTHIQAAPVFGAADTPILSQNLQEQEQSGLVWEDGHYCYYEDGELVTSQWMTAENDTFYFDEEGKAAVGSCSIDGTYYIFDETGRLIQPSDTKMVQIETEDGYRKFYVDAEGKAVSGWSDNKKYYFDQTGEAVTGITVIKEKFYSFYASGKYDQTKTKKIRKAAKYEKPFSNLQKYIGKPKKAKYYASCYGKGKDGILTYDRFTVYTFKPDSGAELFMGAE